MYSRILIATEGSEVATKAARHGIALAKSLKAAVIITTVTEPWSAFELSHASKEGVANPLATYHRLAGAEAKRILAVVADFGKAEGVSCELVHVEDKYPADGIIATASNRGCDLIVMGSHGRRGIDRILLGSQANEVLTRSKVPTLVVR